MADVQDDTENKQGSREPPDATKYTSEPRGGYEPHPLFPLDDDRPEHRDIQFIAFRRRRSDGRIDNTAEDVPAGELHSWAQIVGPWGGGEYKAIGKDKNHRVVAWYPEKNGEWLLFDLESKPFTLRDQRYQHSPPMAAPAAAPMPAPAPAPAVAVAALLPAQNPLEATLMEVLKELRASRAPAADTAMTEVLKELRASRAATADTAMTEVLKELRASRAPVTSSTDTAMVEMIKAQGELMRTVLGAVLTQRPVEASSKPTIEPTTMALQLLGAMREWAPKPQDQASVTDRLGEYRAIRELTTPAAPPAAQSEFGEIKDLLSSVMQADALSKSTRQATPPPPVLEHRPPPPERRPPLPRAPLRYVPGLGMVDVVQPEGPPLRIEAPPPRPEGPPLRSEGPPPRPTDRDLDYATLQRDPTQRERMLKALGLEKPVSPATAVESMPLPEVPALVIPSVQVALEPTPEVFFAPEAPAEREVLETASEPTPPLALSPIEALPIAPLAADERLAIELPEHMPSVESRAITDAQRERAQESIVALSKLPDDQLLAALTKIPGVGTHAKDLLRAMKDLPSTALPFVANNLPADMVRALAGGPGG